MIYYLNPECRPRRRINNNPFDVKNSYVLAADPGAEHDDNRWNFMEELEQRNSLLFRFFARHVLVTVA